MKQKYLFIGGVAQGQQLIFPDDLPCIQIPHSMFKEVTEEMVSDASCREIIDEVTVYEKHRVRSLDSSSGPCDHWFYVKKGTKISDAFYLLFGNYEIV